MSRLFLVAGAVLAAIGVGAGAFGAHGLTSRVTPARLDTFETGVRYQMYHALALLALGWMATLTDAWQVSASGILFLIGIAIFSGSLYVLVLTDTGWLGAITPFGGVALIAGWIFFAWGASTL